MLKYLFDYIILLIIFIVPPFLFKYIPNGGAAFLALLPTINVVAEAHILLIIPYTFLIVKFLFIHKVNKTNDIINYLSIKKKLMFIVTILNVAFSIFEGLVLQKLNVGISYSVFILVFLYFLKPKEEQKQILMNKNINDYYQNKKR